ncbi:polysaccharide biosynthesis protein, partial|uniref:hypothetical protein n=1 Tax=Escherichia coli TaxID=562 RepID=UPI0016A04A66
LVLADSGIAAGVMAQGGKNWQDRRHLGVVLQTGLTLRKQFSAGSLLVALLILLYFLLHHEASWLEAVLICLSLVPAFWANLTGELLEISLKLQQQVVSLQRVQVIGNAGRLLMTGLGVLVLPWTVLVVLVNGITQVFINRRIRTLA